MNVKRLDGRLLNFWVAKSAGLTLATEPPAPGQPHDPQGSVWHPERYNPANDWSHAGSIIASEWYAIEDTLVEWFGTQWPHTQAVAADPLKWFLRAYVSTQYGDEVEAVPELPWSTPQTATPTRHRPEPNTPDRRKSRWTVWLRPINW